MPPTNIPVWGSSAAPGDIVEPSSGQIASGIKLVGSPAIPQKLSYQWFNWLMNSITSLLN